MPLHELTAFFANLHWREPLWLLLALQPLLIILLRRYQRKSRIGAYAEPSLQPWVVVSPNRDQGSRLPWRNITALLAWILFALAAAGPRLVMEENHTASTPRGNIFLLVDISRSMQATDIQPNRLRRARIEIDELLAHAPGHRIGIILFAGRAHLYVPLTSDYNALRHFLDTLDRLAPPTYGSRPGPAVEMANNLLKHTPQPGDIILLTDGDTASGNLNNQTKYPLHILGLGTEGGGAIQTPDGDWLQHQGQPVVTRMNETALRQLAANNGGRYSKVEADNSDWRRIYDQGVARHQPATAVDAAKDHTLWHELYAWCLTPGVLLLLLSSLPPIRRTSPLLEKEGVGGDLIPLNPPFPKGEAKNKLSALLIAPLLLFSLLAHVDTVEAADQQQAYKKYQKQDYARALQIYRRLTGFHGRLGEGATHYRMGNFDKAAHSFINAVLIAPDDRQRATALFNLGNSYFQLGDYANASTVFGDVLRYQPEHDAGRFNQALSRSLQAAVEQRMRQSGSRPGSGPRRANARPNMVIGQNSSLSVGDSEDERNKNLPLPDLPSEQRERLIARGLEQVKFAAGGKRRQQRFKVQEREMTLTDARLRMMDQQDNQENLWNRLFEMEEGFPAPLEEPKPIPGVDPW